MTTRTKVSPALNHAQKSALKVLRAYATGRSSTDFREHNSGMTLTFTSRYRESIERIRAAVRVLGGAVYGTSSGMRANGSQRAARHTTIEWCVSPSADNYCLNGGKIRDVRL